MSDFQITTTQVPSVRGDVTAIAWTHAATVAAFVITEH
jgi:hypothetical protein